jgi:tetratricopeptide (TPR) repeat protein
MVASSKLNSARGGWLPASSRRLLRGVAVVLVLTAGTIAFVLWWEDRPIREIERALNRKDFDAALRSANSYLAVSPERIQVLDQKARALAGLQRWSEAARLFEQIGPVSVSSQRAFSQVLLHQERWSEALPLLKLLDRLSPEDPDVLHELAACQSKLGQFDEAVGAAERLARLVGHEDRGGVLLGMVQFKRANYRRAIEAWQPVLDRNPEAANLQLTPAEFLSAFGRALLESGRAAEARPHLARAAQLDPTPEVCNALAEACEQVGDVPQAAELWRKVVERNPADRAAREGLASLALENKAADEARAWLDPLLPRGDLKSSTAYLMQRAAVLKGDKAEAASWEQRVLSLRNHEKKMSALDQAVRDSPQSYWSRALRAHRFAREGNTSQALLLTGELLRQQPEQPFVQQLNEALRNGKPLPSLDLIPYEQF